MKVDGKGCCSSIEDETTKNDATEAQQASNSTDGTKCMGCSINGHQAAKTKETTSSESSKDIQGSPCSSCGDSCSKCPDCCSYNAENKNNPEAIISSTTGMKYKIILLIFNIPKHNFDIYFYLRYIYLSYLCFNICFQKIINCQHVMT